MHRVYLWISKSCWKLANVGQSIGSHPWTLNQWSRLCEVWRNGCGSRWNLEFASSRQSGSGGEVTADQDGVIAAYLPWSLVCLLCAWVLAVAVKSDPSIMGNRNCVWQKLRRARQRNELPDFHGEKIHRKSYRIPKKNAKILERAEKR